MEYTISSFGIYYKMNGLEKSIWVRADNFKDLHDKLVAAEKEIEFELLNATEEKIQYPDEPKDLEVKHE